MASNELQRKLYHGIEKTPVVAWNAGLSAREIERDRPFVTPVELWARDERLARTLAACGVGPTELTGAAADFEKLTAWLAALPLAAGATAAADLAADLTALGAGEHPLSQSAEALWCTACDTLAKADVTPRALLSQNRASFVVARVEEGMPNAPLGEGVYPLPSLDAIFAIEAPDFSPRMTAFLRRMGEGSADLSAVERAIGGVLGQAKAQGARAVTVDVSALGRFERPNPYHAGLALAKGLSGNALEPKETAIWHAQVLRMLGLAAKALGLVIHLRALPKTEHVLGDFSVLALEKLLVYLKERSAMTPTILSLRAGELPRGLSRLIARFAGEDGTPELYFGMEGTGAPLAAFSRSLRFYAERGALALLVGLTDSDRGHFSAPTRGRFARALAAELARTAREDETGLYTEGCLLSLARAVLADRAAALLGL